MVRGYEAGKIYCGDIGGGNMTINGKRNFNHNGKKYYIQNLPKADIIGNKKYNIAIVENGIYRIAYNKLGWTMEKFETIKDAQRYVRDYDFLLETF